MPRRFLSVSVVTMSTVDQALFQLRESAEKAAAAAAANGVDIGGTQQPGVMEMELSDIQRQVPGSLLKMTDDSFAVVPAKRGVIAKSGGEKVAVSVATDNGPATQKEQEWLSANVKSAWLGMLAFEGGGGAGANAKHAAAGVPVSITPEMASAITKLKLVIGGVAGAPKPIDEALATTGLVLAAGAEERAWGGGFSPPVLLSGPGIKAPSEASGVELLVPQLVGGGTFGALRATKLAALSVPADKLQAGVAAQLLAALLEDQRMVSAHTVGLAGDRAAVTTAASPDPKAVAMLDAADAMRAQLGKLLDWLPQAALEGACDRVAALQSAGMWLSAAQAGAALYALP